MENQHRQIKGYRELSQEEIDLMNKIKKLGPKIDFLFNILLSLYSTDKRWLSIGRDHLQQGLMALTRSVAKSESF